MRKRAGHAGHAEHAHRYQEMLVALVASLAMLAGGLAGAAAAPGSATAEYATAGNCISFAETGKSVCNGFMAYWRDFGGLAIYGFPISDEMMDPATGLTVQYFQRARFEWHPGAWASHYDVELSRLGWFDALHHNLLKTDPFAAKTSCPAGQHCVAFSQTGHTLSNGFLAYWEQNGGLAAFGYPISQEFVENGLTVQYFERARFEWHPSVAPKNYDTLLGLLGSDLYTAQHAISLVASGLDNPRGLAFAPDGALYVAEAGKGGNGTCVPNPEGGANECYGESGAITKIAGGQQSRAASGLPSLAGPDGSSATGPTSVSSHSGGDVYFVVGLGADPSARDQLPDVGAKFGHLYVLHADGKVEELTDISAYETAHNPEPGAVDSNPYAVLDLGDKRIVADAGGNDLLEVDADGTIKTLAVFPTRMVDAPPFVDAPPGTKMPMEAVPTSVVQGPDGAFYVGELTGFPFLPGAARVWRVVPGQQPQVFAEGFTNIIGLSFGPDGSLYVLEITAKGLAQAEGPGGDPTGALIRVLPDGSRWTVASEGLVAPGGVTIGPDGSIYLSNFSIMAGQGAVVKLNP